MENRGLRQPLHKSGRIPNHEFYLYCQMCGRHVVYGLDQRSETKDESTYAGKGAKYTKNRRPVSLEYFESYETKEEAMRREYEIKQLTRKEKLKLIKTVMESD